MPRGIRELRHQRVLFGDLSYTPDQNPYKPSGIRKMEDTWITPGGDGYVSIVPGYSELDDLADDAAVPYGMRLMTGFDSALGYMLYPVAMYYHSPTSTKLYKVEEDGSLSEIYEWTTNEIIDRAFGGVIPGYSYKTTGYVFTGSWGDAETVGIRFNLSQDGGLWTVDGTHEIGLARPDVETGDDTGAAATSAIGAGDGEAVKGVVKYFCAYTGQDGNQEGALSEEFGEIDCGDGSEVDLTNLPTSGTNKVRLYRTFKDGDQPFYLATLDADTTSYTDNIADADLGDLPLKMGDPPDPNRGIISSTWHFGRAYYLTNNHQPRRAHFSDPEEPESFYVTEFGNWFSISDSFRAKVLSRVPEGLLYLSDHAAYLLVGRSPADFVVHEMGPVTQGTYSLGCAANGGCRETPGGTYFYDKTNYSIYRVSPRGTLEQTAQGQLSVISEPIRDEIRDNDDDPTDLLDVRMHLGYWPDQNILIASTGRTNGPQGEGIMWFYDIDEQRWIGKANYGPMSLCQWSSSSDGNALAMLTRVTGKRDKLYQALTGVNRDATAPSSPTVGAPTFTGSDPTLEKTFYYVDLLMKGESGKTVTVNWFIDGATTADGTASVSLTGTDSRERHRVYINERGREIDVDVVLDNTSTDHGIYGLIFGFTEDTSVVGS